MRVDGLLVVGGSMWMWMWMSDVHRGKDGDGKVIWENALRLAVLSSGPNSGVLCLRIKPKGGRHGHFDLSGYSRCTLTMKEEELDRPDLGTHPTQKTYLSSTSTVQINPVAPSHTLPPSKQPTPSTTPSL